MVRGLYINAQTKEIDMNSTLIRQPVTPKVQSWLDAHPILADASVADLVRLAFSEREVQSVFDIYRAI